MNERFKQLWEEAAKTTQGDSWEEQIKFMERYTELIVRECANMAESFHRHQYDMTGNLELHEFIREHFGVEE